MKILVFPGTTLIGIEIFKSLKFIPNLEVYGAGSDLKLGKKVGYANFFYLPNVTNPLFISQLKTLIIEEEISVLFPANDEVISFLSKNEISDCIVVSHPQEVVTIASSKIRTHQALDDLGVVPKRYFDLPADGDFPVFIKPEFGHSSIGAELILNVQQLKSKAKNNLDFWGSYLVTEALVGIEVTVDCFSTKSQGLLYARPRTRIETLNGVSTSTEDYYSDELLDLSRKISEKLPFDGPWFFQAKQDCNGHFKIMEIAARIAGGSAIRRAQGVNLSQLAILNISNSNLGIYNSRFKMLYKNTKKESSIYTENTFKSIYVDFDDTLFMKGAVNTELLDFIENIKPNNTKIILISRHKGNLANKLEELNIINLFDQIIHITNGESKSKFFEVDNFSVFIDDSFSERLSVSHLENVLAVDPSAVSILKGLFLGKTS